MQHKKTFTGIVLILITGLVLTYANHFDNAFHFDDFHTIVENPFIRKLSNIPAFFKDGTTFSTLPSNQSYRPVTSVTLAVDYWLGKSNDPFFFHLSTFIWFLVQGLLMFFLFQVIFNLAQPHRWNSFFALFATAIYCFHPAIAETVNYVIARSDLLSTLCVIGSLLIFIKWRNLRKWQIHLVPMIIGVLIKPTALMYAPILFAYILLFEKKLPLARAFDTSENRKKLFSVVKESLPAFIGFIVLYFFTEKMTPSTWEPGGSDRILYIATQPHVIIHYLKTFFLPTGLSADTDWGPVKSLTDPKIWMGLLFIGFMIYIAIRSSASEKYRPVSFGILWFFFALVPTSLVPLAEVMNDHRVFFPYAGLTIAVCWYVATRIISYERPVSASRNIPVVLLASIFLILTLLAFQTYKRNKVWDTEESLWYDVTRKSPKNGRGLMNYGVIKMGQGDYKTAETYFKRALKFTPEYAVLHVNLGVINNALGKPQEAENYFNNALRFNPGYPAGRFFYAKFLISQKRYNDAIIQLNNAIELSPAYMDARHLLMETYNLLGNDEVLKRVATQTLQYDPADPVAQLYINGTLNRMPPTQPNVTKMTAEELLNLSLTYYNAGDYKKCIEMSDLALKLKPDYAEAYNNICAAYNQLKQWDKAIAAGKKAVALKPDFQLAKNNLNWAQSNKK